jgi:hypothetical protein
MFWSYYMYHFLQTLKANADETAEKTENFNFINVSSNLILQQTTAWENKFVKIVAP